MATDDKRKQILELLRGAVSKDDARGYGAHKERARARQAAISKAGREIGKIPAIAEPNRRKETECNLQLWAETYFPHRFPLPWSQDHIAYWTALDRTIVHGGQKAEAMPRGSGKTTMIEVASIKAIVTGIRRYTVPIGPVRRDALKMLRAIRLELELNELLAADYPEVCYPIRALEGINQRAKGQLCQGLPTRMELSKESIIFPTIPDSPASGGIIEVRTITGAIRGMKHTMPDGEILRPDIVLIDDFQTKKSAKSPDQCEARLEILRGDVMGLAGPTKKIACLVTCTVIVKGDAADQLLDREKNPVWQGTRVPFVITFPANQDLWDKYADIRREGLRDGDMGASASSFYKKNRKAMDAGADVYWKHRFDADEISAIQHAMNKLIDDPNSFYSEYQNDPRDPLDALAAGRLKKEELLAKIAAGGVQRGVVPLAAQHLVGFIDVQQKILYWVVCGIGENFTGGIVDAGSFPDQGRAYYSNADARRSYQKLRPTADFDGQLFGALDDCVNELMSREWKSENGTTMSIGKLLIDANWGKSTDVVYQFSRESDYKGIVMPSHGKGITASQTPLNEYQRKPGDLVGHNWRVPAHAPRGNRYVLWDTNAWKTFAADLLRSSHGDRGSMSFFKDKRAGGLQQMLVEHFVSEYPTPVQGRGRNLEEWKMQPGHDNHFWDCFVGCCVAASMLGVTTVGQKKRGAKKRIKLSELQRKKQQDGNSAA